MFTKNITFKNFKVKKKNSNKKRLLSFIKDKNLYSKIPLLKSLSKNYRLSYDKKIINHLKRYKVINLIGMGGSILGTQTIYKFLQDKIQKKFIFFDNLQIKNFQKSNKKRLNIIVSKSGNTIETITNLNLILGKEKNKNIFITEMKDSFLTQLANKLKADVIEHKILLEGVFSAFRGWNVAFSVNGIK